MKELVDGLRAHGGFAAVETLETLTRFWHVRDRSLRPEHRMVAHTGFLDFRAPPRARRDVRVDSLPIAPIPPKPRTPARTIRGRRTMTKAEIREKVWTTIDREGVARFPGARGRIPNFTGAEQAAQLLRELAVWRRALVVKVNPDAPQLPVRRLALAEGKILYMAVPRLRTEKCFIELDPQRFAKGVVPSASIAAACRVRPRRSRRARCGPST